MFGVYENSDENSNQRKDSTKCIEIQKLSGKSEDGSSNNDYDETRKPKPYVQTMNDKTKDGRSTSTNATQNNSYSQSEGQTGFSSSTQRDICKTRSNSVSKSTFWRKNWRIISRMRKAILRRRNSKRRAHHYSQSVTPFNKSSSTEFEQHRQETRAKWNINTTPERDIKSQLCYTNFDPHLVVENENASLQKLRKGWKKYCVYHIDK